MAATVNTNAASTGESIRSPRSPPRRASSGAARTSSPTWNQIVCGAGPKAESLFAHPPPPPLPSSESLAMAVVPEFGYERCSHYIILLRNLECLLLHKRLLNESLIKDISLRQNMDEHGYICS